MISLRSAGKRGKRFIDFTQRNLIYLTESNLRSTSHKDYPVETDKCIICKVYVCVCPTDLSVVDWRLERDTKKKCIDFIFCDNRVKYYSDMHLAVSPKQERQTHTKSGREPLIPSS